jgi:hypothetical protein
VVIYVEDPNKTERARFIEKADMDAIRAQGLEDVIDYAMALEKTVPDEDKQTMRYFVSGINCTPGSARDEMMAAKVKYEKEAGIVAFHSYQSFAPGEVSPEMAHEIGVKLAQKLWGERFQIIVATHLDKDHIHNHIVCNSVSHADGNRFRCNKTTYRLLREASDELCLEYGLSVIDSPEHGRSKHHAEWRAEREGRPTWRATIKADIDEAIEKAMTDRQFFENLKAMGYEYKVGKDISVRPPGKERFLRLARNFGDDYTMDGIKSRLLRHRYPRMPVPRRRPKDFTPPKKLPFFAKGSLLALHRHQLYLIGFYTERGSPGSNARMHYLLREDLAKLDIYIEDTKLLQREDIQTAGQLHLFADKCNREIAALKGERTELKAQIRAVAGEGNPYTTKDNPRYQQINQRLKTLRREVMQCGRIDERSRSLASRIERIEQDEDKLTQQPKDKEATRHGRNRTGH